MIRPLRRVRCPGGAVMHKPGNDKQANSDSGAQSAH
nr:MAG TPA: hypothetical protein [Caudoviricetes sp.]